VNRILLFISAGCGKKNDARHEKSLSSRFRQCLSNRKISIDVPGGKNKILKNLEMSASVRVSVGFPKISANFNNY
jgi:hypothetical protein